MKRIFLTVLLLLVGGPAWANSCPSYPYTLTNGTTADANQVMSNFNTVMNCASFFIGGTTSGSASAQTLASVSPGVYSLTAGNRVTFMSGFTTTGATTLNVASTGTLNVLKKTSAGLVALASNDMVSGQVYTVQYDGTQYELLDPVPSSTVQRSYLAGLALANDGTSPNTVLDIAPGQAADSSNTVYINLSSFSKSTAGTWAAGSGNNGMGKGLTIAANTWYHVFAIIANGAADVYFDTSVTAANAPTGTSVYRRIGSFKTDGSAHILAFSQVGDWFFWKTSELDANQVAASTTAASVTLTVPPDVNVMARVIVSMAGQTPPQSVWAYSPVMNDQAASPTLSIMRTPTTYNMLAQIDVMTNTSSQIRWVSDGTTGSTSLYTIGWQDYRGRFN